ncbi:superoxide dismutase [Sphingomonas astaxanthinifaciens]|uniref:Superoxide dismutase n=1 Tax=Sphingomonas astaxanthinifaciens DSM 22298 TaxID=1123267 RepID=A0ABQ5Z9U5_9SPHN|nr:superoxide dismutase [Sphingomonas astaxanthinifaciens]GLR48417.1 superoxide dismutase [Sphingomonas astaxanthinifaciens DSM 22298]
MAFEVAPLPYDYAALEPTIDATTMKLHHDKHHQTYVDNLNKAVDGDASLQGKSLEELVAMAGAAPKVVRNNGGGHWNHNFFWETMKPGGGSPSGELASAIDSAFGGLDALKEKFNAAGAGQFGSGWVWLVAVPGQGLVVTSTPNQDNPLMDIAEVKGTPIIGNDVWEHAYYLTYNNRRADYLKAWWDVVNWDKASERLQAAR